MTIKGTTLITIRGPQFTQKTSFSNFKTSCWKLLKTYSEISVANSSADTQPRGSVNVQSEVNHFVINKKKHDIHSAKRQQWSALRANNART